VLENVSSLASMGRRRTTLPLLSSTRKTRSGNQRRGALLASRSGPRACRRPRSRRNSLCGASSVAEKRLGTGLLEAPLRQELPRLKSPSLTSTTPSSIAIRNQCEAGRQKGPVRRDERRRIQGFGPMWGRAPGWEVPTEHPLADLPDLPFHSGIVSVGQRFKLLPEPERNGGRRRGRTLGRRERFPAFRRPARDAMPTRPEAQGWLPGRV
jgi:hypothetical protein